MSYKKGNISRFSCFQIENQSLNEPIIVSTYSVLSFTSNKRPAPSAYVRALSSEPK